MHGEVDQAVVIVESFVAVGVSIMRLGFGVFLPQPSPHALSHLPLHFIEHPRAIGVMKVADPSPHPAIDAGDDLIGFLPHGAPGSLLPDRLPQFAAAFRAGLTVRIVPATSRFPPRQTEPKELETLLLEVHDPCLLFVELEPPFLQPAFQPTVHRRSLPFTTEDNEVVGISDHQRFHLLAPVDGFVQAVEIEVGQ